MDVREKLVELLDRFVYDDWYSNNDIAEKLISNGVTVQEWISVKDRMPQEDGAYLVTTNYFGNHQGIDILCFAKDGKTVDEYNLAGEKDVWYFYDSEYGYVPTDSVTHWMPLPERRKENDYGVCNTL